MGGKSANPSSLKKGENKERDTLHMLAAKHSVKPAQSPHAIQKRAEPAPKISTERKTMADSIDILGGSVTKRAQAQPVKKISPNAPPRPPQKPQTQASGVVFEGKKGTYSHVTNYDTQRGATGSQQRKAAQATSVKKAEGDKPFDDFPRAKNYGGFGGFASSGGARNFRTKMYSKTEVPAVKKGQTPTPSPTPKREKSFGDKVNEFVFGHDTTPPPNVVYGKPASPAPTKNSGTYGKPYVAKGAARTATTDRTAMPRDAGNPKSQNTGAEVLMQRAMRMQKDIGASFVPSIGVTDGKKRDLQAPAKNAYKKK
jgi:hypothetical protein